MYKKTVLVFFLIWMCLFLFDIIAAQKPPEVQKKYWQDLLFKPNQAWIEKYGFDNDSQLAYNIVYSRNMIQRQQRQIVALTKQIEAQTETTDVVIDPNDPK